MHVLDLDEQRVAGLGAFNLKGAGQVVDLGQVDFEDVFGGVVVADLAAGPVYAFDVDDFAVGDFACEGDWEGIGMLEFSLCVLWVSGCVYHRDASGSIQDGD